MCPRPSWAKTDPERWRKRQERRLAHMIYLIDRAQELLVIDPTLSLGVALEYASIEHHFCKH